MITVLNVIVACVLFNLSALRTLRFVITIALPITLCATLAFYTANPFGTFFIVVPFAQLEAFWNGTPQIHLPFGSTTSTSVFLWRLSLSSFLLHNLKRQRLSALHDSMLPSSTSCQWSWWLWELHLWIFISPRHTGWKKMDLYWSILNGWSFILYWWMDF